MQLVTQTARIAGATPRYQAVPEPGLGRGIDGVFGDLGEPTLLLTKIRIPRACGEPVRRERLEGLTRQIKQRVLTLVTAPPGCGKTTLAQHWAEQLIEQDA